MRICLYTGTALPKLGGQEAVVDALARHFTRLGHPTMVLAPLPRRPVRPDDLSLPYPVIRHPRFYSTRHFVSWYRRWLLSARKRFGFEVLHCHDVYPTGYLAALCRQRLGVPVVITSHGGDVREGNIRISKPGMQERYALAVRAADALVSIGRFTEEGFRRLHPEAPHLIDIPNGIDLEPFRQRAPRPAGLDGAVRENEYALFLGRLKHRKGVDLLLEALALVPAGAHQGVQLVIAGAGEEQAAVEAQVARLGLVDRVRRVGRVDGADKLYLLQNALFTVMPSRVWEAFPLVVLESYAAGRAVVGSSIPGIVDLVREGHTGMLFPEESVPGLAEAITTMFSHRDRARAMGETARRVADGYSWDSVARQHLALYEQLLAAQVPAGPGRIR